MLVVYYSIIILIVVEIFLRLPVKKHVFRINHYTNRSYHVIRSPVISDHWKEKVILIYAGRIMGSTLSLILYFLLLAGIFIVISSLGSIIDGFPPQEDLLNFAGSIKVMLISTIFVVIYIFARTRNAAS